MKRAYSIVAVALLIIAAGVAVARWPRASAARTLRPIETAKVKAGDVDVALRVPGVVQAAKSEPVVNWAQETQLVWLLPEGSWVKSGDVVIKTNVANAKKQLAEAERQHASGEQQNRTQVEDAQRRLQNATTGLDKAKDDMRLVQLEGQAKLERAQAEYDFNEKEVAVAKGEQSKYQRLADSHLVPATRLDSAGDEVRRKEFALEKAKRDLARAGEDAKVAEQLKQLEVDKAQLELQSAQAGLKQAQADAARAQAIQGLKLQEAAEQVAYCEIKAQSAGMLLLENRWDMGIRKLRVGDQVGEGQKVASIIDPAKMLVQCDVGEADISRVRVGQSGRVRVPAIGNKELRGSVQAIDNLAQERYIWEGGTPGKRVFNVALALTEADKRLRPGMSGTVEIVVDEAKQALSVPVQALFGEDGKAIVYVRRGDAFEAVPVKITDRSEMEAAIDGLVKPGEEVACERPPADRVATAKERKR